LVEAILNNELAEKKVSVMAIIPFLESEDVTRLFEASLAGKIEVCSSGFLPFLSSEEITNLVEKIKSGEQENLSIESVMPFLDEDQIKSLFKEILESLKKSKEE